MRVRGLKLLLVFVTIPARLVAPHAGAWIETQLRLDFNKFSCKSHPMRVRGLKLSWQPRYSEYKSSHPMRVRGLKLKLTNAENKGLEGRTPCGCVD